jgi:hypothetical protein
LHSRRPDTERRPPLRSPATRVRKLLQIAGRRYRVESAHYAYPSTTVGARLTRTDRCHTVGDATATHCAVPTVPRLLGASERPINQSLQCGAIGTTGDGPRGGNDLDLTMRANAVHAVLIMRAKSIVCGPLIRHNLLCTCCDIVQHVATHDHALQQHGVCGWFPLRSVIALAASSGLSHRIDRLGKERHVAQQAEAAAHVLCSATQSSHAPALPFKTTRAVSLSDKGSRGREAVRQCHRQPFGVR